MSIATVFGIREDVIEEAEFLKDLRATILNDSFFN